VTTSSLSVESAQRRRNVDITAGGDVYSYLPNGQTPPMMLAPGFGPEAGNVNITAGAASMALRAGQWHRHHHCQNGDVGTRAGVTEFALSLIAGSWTVNAPNGSIYLQEVRNPNGVFNNQGNKSDPAASICSTTPLMLQ